MCRRIGLWLLVAGLTLAGAFGGQAEKCFAGGGPQNLFLVVNARSWASVTIANYYVAMRKIPANNVLYIDWPHSPVEAPPIDQFRDEILKPTLLAIDQRGLGAQIDCVAYSSDFPFRVDVGPDLKSVPLGQGFLPFGTINSLTYLWQLTLSKQVSPMQIGANFYYSKPTESQPVPESRAFHLLTTWNQAGQPVTGQGQRHLMAAMLAVTSGRGTSVSEAIDYLGRSVQADATQPQQTVYFSRTNDPRSVVRQPEFLPAIKTLEQLGVKGAIIETPLPEGRDDVLGLITGVANFDWAKSRSKILPGAFCDNLTSTGGFLHDSGNQTPITDFLRAGAAGASGTVIEPLAIPAKFPSCFMPVHYARGCSLAEAFYQSVHGPFQLLLIADPLCQPWARPGTVEVTGVEDGATVSGKLTFKVKATTAGGGPARHVEVFVDGRRGAKSPAEEEIIIDTANFVDGYHELNVVAIDNTPIEIQGRKLIPIKTDNHGQKVSISMFSDGQKFKYGQRLKFTVAADGEGVARRALFQLNRAVGKQDGTTGDFELDSRILGMGPIRLQAASLDAMNKPLAVSDPIEFSIEPPDALPPVTLPKGKKAKPGLEITLASGRKVAVEDTSAFDWLTRAGVREGEKYTLSGYFEAPVADTYQLLFSYLGQLTIKIDGKPLYQGTTPEKTPVPWGYLPFSLQPGLHKVEFVGKCEKYRTLYVRIGGPGAWTIGSRQFVHTG